MELNRVTENPDQTNVKICGKYSGIIELSRWFDPKSKFSVLLILNQRIHFDEAVFRSLWNRYAIKICADGGSNRLYDFYCGPSGERYVPDAVTGDMDSIREEVLKYYQKRTRVYFQDSQYATDFTKSVHLATLFLMGIELKPSGVDQSEEISFAYDKADTSELFQIPLLVFNGIDGRFDHTIHSIHQFYALRREAAYYNVCFVTSNDMLILVPDSKDGYWLDLSRISSMVGHCGLLPMAGPTTIKKTKGLKWDVENWETSIAGGRVSSSNWFVSDQCLVICDQPIVINIELQWDRLLGLLHQASFRAQAVASS